MLVIFLNNKIMTCDTIIPLALEFRHRFPNRKILFIVFDNKTLSVLKSNIVIWNAIISCGKIFSVDIGSGKWFNLIRVMKVLSYILLRTLVSKVAFIHFKILRENPFYFFYLINKKRTFFFESDSLTRTDYHDTYHDKYSKHKKIVTDRPSAEYYVCTTNRWSGIKNAVRYKKEVVITPSFRSSRLWIEYIDNIVNENFIPRNGPSIDKPIITFLLGSLDKIPFTKTEIRKFLVKTLDVLDELTGDTKVFLKPHFITDIDLLLEILKCRDKDKYIISYLHPSVLASRSIFVICNCYSMAVLDAYFRSIPVVEYTDYNDNLLSLTNHGSIGFGVDYFINNDASKLHRTLQSIMNGNIVSTSKIDYSNKVDFDYLFELLSR